MSNDNILDQAASLAGENLEFSIVDGAMRITPADGGIALLAALATQNGREDQLHDHIETLERVIEKLRDENAAYRDLLDECRERVLSFGFEDFANKIMTALWPVVGVLEDGTEVPVEMDWNKEDGE